MSAYKFINAALAAAALTAAALAGCAQEPPQVPPAPPVIASGQCDESAAQFAVGKPANGPLAEEARGRSSAQRVRMVHPGQMVTMEFDVTRLTLDVDAAGKVVRARCG